MVQDYTRGKGAIWREDGRWHTAPASGANELIAIAVEMLGVEGANAQFKVLGFMTCEEATRIAQWRKQVVRAAAQEICDTNLADLYPQGQRDLTDAEIFAAFAGWASFGFELDERARGIAQRHFGRDLDDGDRAELASAVEFCAIGYCGL
jgi:hypothetical protein